MGAFLETPQAVRRRRAFFSAMAPLVGRDAALEAINLWEQTFGSDQPLLRGISKYAAIVVAELQWKVSAPDLSVRLLEHLQLDEAALPPDPLPLLTGRRSNGTAAADAAPSVTPTDALSPRGASAPGAPRPRSRQSAVARSLGVLLLRLCDHAGQADARSQAALVRSFVAACGGEFSREIATDIGALLTGRSTELALDYPQPLATKIVNTFYVPLAEFYGPVSADRIVTQAVRSAQDAPEAREFSPRDLL